MTKKIDKILKHCFDSTNLKNVKESKKNAEKHIIKAHNNLRAMNLMYENDLFDWTVACGYYAMWYVMSIVDTTYQDYVIGWILWGIGNDPDLSKVWAFKGGTSLKKCFIETWRFSEDLDFTVLPGGPFAPDKLAPIIKRILEKVMMNQELIFLLEI